MGFRRFIKRGIKLSHLEEKYFELCKNIFSEDERKHLEEALHADLDGYWEEVKDVLKKDPEKSSAQEQVDNILERDFTKWKNLSNSIFKKCKLNKWETPNV